MIITKKILNKIWDKLIQEGISCRNRNEIKEQGKMK